MKSTLQLFKVILCLIFLIIISNKIYSQAGTLDLSFGNGGKDTTGMLATSEPDTQKEKINKLLVQKNQKIVAVGYVQNEYVDDSKSRSAIALARYDVEGKLDTTFGDKGKMLESNFVYCSDAGLQSNDKIITVGNIDDTITGQGYPILARFTKDGLLDSSFGKNGFMDTSGRISNLFWQTKILNDNSIIITGQDGNNPQRYPNSIIEKYLPNGKIDSSFAINGRFNLFNHALGSHSIAVQKDGKLLFLISSGNHDTSLVKIIRLTTTGNYDLSFGDSGSIVIGKLNTANYLDSINDIPSGLFSLTTDDKIITTGINNLTKKGYIKKYNSDGTIDNSFDTNGEIWIDTNIINTYNKFIQSSIIIQPDNKIILSGLYSYTDNNTLPDFASVRFKIDGSTDSSFGNNGLAITDFGVDARSLCSALQKDNKLLVGGYSSRTNDLTLGYALENFALCRYNSDIVLPITLLSFTAKKQNETSLLNWQTANEINNNYFSVERSKDSKLFTEINKLKCKGNSSQTQSYTFTDNKPFQGWNYYRLKQVDNDGKFSYSSVASVFFDNVNNISIYPNPAKNYLQIDGLKDGINSSLIITDANGKTVITTTASTSTYTLNIQNLASGVYYLTIIEDGKTMKEKFIKQ